MKEVLIGNSIVDLMFTTAVSILAAGGHTVSSIAVPGNTVQDQINAWLASPIRGDATYSVGVIQVGINDIRTAVALATTLANFATLINDIRSQNPTMKIILGLMLPARTDPSVTGSYASKYLPIQNAILAAGTGGSIPAVDRIMTSANAAMNDGTDALLAAYDSGDHLHPNTGGTRLNAVEVRANINALFGLVDPVPDGGAGRGHSRKLGEWRAPSMTASTNLLMSRATGQSTAAQVRRRCRVVGFGFLMHTLGQVVPVAGSAITVQLTRTSWQGYDVATTPIGQILVGESNDFKPIAPPVQLEAADMVEIRLVTDGAFTSTTCAPSISLETVEN